MPIMKIPFNLKEIAFDIAKARILIDKGDLEGAQDLLDDAADRMPNEYWPTDQEVEASID